MKNAIKYQRTVAYFESKFLSLVANGLKDFILNNGKMELVCGPKLTQSEIDSINKGISNPQEIITSNFLKDIETIEDEIVLNHVKMLGWMIAKNLLDIKIAIKKDSKGRLSNSSGILHYKVGILYDKSNNIVSFSGSSNDTYNAWSKKNLEEFHVFRSWNSKDFEHLKSNIDTFNSVWYGSESSFEIMDVPIAARKKLIEISPEKLEDLIFEEDKESVKSTDGIESIELYEYQKEAKDNWLKNGKMGIFQMATGTGKTYTALGCLDYLMNHCDKLITVITAPSNHILIQWKKSILKFPILTDKILIADSTNNKWFNEVSNYLGKMVLSNKIKKIVILTTHDTFYGVKFRNLLCDFNNFHYFLIGDEMHGLGSVKHRLGLVPELYNFRLGLSATPVRYSDEETDFLLSFFGDIVYKFSLQKALSSFDKKGRRFLTPFYYKPYFLSLTHEELVEYKEITEKLVKFDRNDKKQLEIVENLLFKRADIIKDAKYKLEILKQILDDLSDYNGLIIFCSPNQIDDVCNLLNEKSLEFSRFTMGTGSKPSYKYGDISQREAILKEFEKGKIEILVSMHCLDEGVDVPSAKQAIFMCSSNSSREFIQRIGRVIRTSEGKKRAYIYDMLITPQLHEKDSLKNYELKIFKREKKRYKKIGNIARNTSEVRKLLDKNIR